MGSSGREEGAGKAESKRPSLLSSRFNCRGGIYLLGRGFIRRLLSVIHSCLANYAEIKSWSDGRSN